MTECDRPAGQSLRGCRSGWLCAPRVAAARRRYAGVMFRPSSDGCRLTARLEPGGPCIAVAEHQPDGHWLVNGRAMSREHVGIALEAAVTVAAACRAGRAGLTADHRAGKPGAGRLSWHQGAPCKPVRHRLLPGRPGLALLPRCGAIR